MHLGGMSVTTPPFERPQRLAVLCAVVATGLGLFYMVLAGAPTRHLAINASALVLGLAIAWAGLRTFKSLAPGVIAGPLALGLLAASLAGEQVEGATRWLAVGGVAIQPSLIVLPLIAMLFAKSPGRGTLASVGLAAVALALQPDRAIAGALTAAMAATAFIRPGAITRTAFALASTGFAAALIQPDHLPAVPFVDGILYTALDVHPLAAAAVWSGSAILLLPAIGRVDAVRTATFGAIWGAIVLAAALGNYPTPLVGYGASAILGYALSLSMLPRGLAKLAADDPALPAPTSPRDCAMAAA